MAEPIHTRDNLRNLVQLSSLINSSLETQEALNNALMSVEQALNAEDCTWWWKIPGSAFLPRTCLIFSTPFFLQTRRHRQGPDQGVSGRQ